MHCPIIVSIVEFFPSNLFFIGHFFLLILNCYGHTIYTILYLAF